MEGDGEDAGEDDALSVDRTNILVEMAPPRVVRLEPEH